MSMKNSRSFNLAGAEATGTNVYRRVGAAHNSLHLADVGLPGSVSLAVRVRNGVTEYHAFSANAALCHWIIPPVFLPEPLAKLSIFFCFNTNGQGVL